MPKKKKFQNEEEKLVQNVPEDNLKKSVLQDVNSNDVMSANTEQERKRQADLKRFLIPVLRRATYRWKERGEALKSARIERGLYKCASCFQDFKAKEVQLDHIYPVVDPKIGWIDWNTFIQRLFVFKEGWQVLCKTCHDEKTMLEDALRHAFSKKKRKK